MRALVLVALFTVACGKPTTRDAPLVGTTEDDPLVTCLERCGGCCELDGQCRAGNAVNACGRAELCQACDDGQTCSLGNCKTPTAPIVVEPPRPGEVTLRWTFSGQACAIVRDVVQVTLDIPGLVLPNQGLFPCSQGAADGITLPSVQPDLYRYTARAMTRDGRLLYEGSGSFSVDGPVTKRIDLSPAFGATGNAAVSWRLPQLLATTPTCASSGIETVTVQASGLPSMVLKCDAQTAMLTGLAAGTRTVTLKAHDATGYLLAETSSTVTVLAGAQTHLEVGLRWVVGGLSVKWEFFTQNQLRSCAQVGATEVYLNVEHQGAFLYPGAGVAVPCGPLTISFPTLPTGDVRVYAQAVSALGLFRSEAVMATVRTGHFPIAGAADSVVLTLGL